jgi:hypothetical protein
MPHRQSSCAKVKFEDTGDHDNRLRPISVLEQRVFERFGAVYEQSSAQAPPVLDYPVAAAVSPDQKE